MIVFAMCLLRCLPSPDRKKTQDNRHEKRTGPSCFKKRWSSMAKEEPKMRMGRMTFSGVRVVGWSIGHNGMTAVVHVLGG